MRITEEVETGKRYYWKRSGGWDWFDGQRYWWEYFVEPAGLNGAGGWWVKVWSRWNSSGFEWRPQTESWSWEKTREVLMEIGQNGYSVDFAPTEATPSTSTSKGVD
jgi:hypothetical protein